MAKRDSTLRYFWHQKRSQMSILLSPKSLLCINSIKQANFSKLDRAKTSLCIPNSKFRSIVYNSSFLTIGCLLFLPTRIQLSMSEGSGSGSVVRAVTSDTKCPRFESSHWQNLYIINICLLSAVLKRRK